MIEKITEALASGRKIEAIRIYREATGKGLKEAKEFIDALMPALAEKDPERFGNSGSKSSGCSAVIMMTFAIGGTLLALVCS